MDYPVEIRIVARGLAVAGAVQAEIRASIAAARRWSASVPATVEPFAVQGIVERIALALGNHAQNDLAWICLHFRPRPAYVGLAGFRERQQPVLILPLHQGEVKRVVVLLKKT